MRIAVMGTGGLGGFIGGMLARHGAEVTFIARGKHLEAIRENGLRVRSHLTGDFRIEAVATDDPRTIGTVDLVLFCVKTYDAEDAAELIRPLMGPRTVILPFQNGVESTPNLKEMYGSTAVLGGVSWINAIVEAPGSIFHSFGQSISLGEWPDGSSDRTAELADRFAAAGVQVILEPHMKVTSWNKFTGICGVVGLSALTRLPIGVMLKTDEARELVRGLMEEADLVARAEGVHRAPDYVELSLAEVIRTFSAAPWAYPSIYYDLVAGRRLEIDALNGALVRLGKLHGIPTPVNGVIYAALKPFVNGAPVIPPAP